MWEASIEYTLDKFHFSIFYMVNEIEAEIESLPLRKLLVTLFNIISTEVFHRVMSIEIRKNSPKGVCVCVCVYVCVCVPS